MMYISLSDLLTYTLVLIALATLIKRGKSTTHHLNPDGFRSGGLSKGSAAHCSLQARLISLSAFRTTLLQNI